MLLEFEVPIGVPAKHLPMQKAEAKSSISKHKIAHKHHCKLIQASFHLVQNTVGNDTGGVYSQSIACNGR